jgi:hypothetical protein
MGGSTAEMALKPGLFNKIPVLFRVVDMISIRHEIT